MTDQDKAKKLAKIKDKITKLLALATSDNPNEAATAMRQAMSMMQKHAITEHDLDEDDKTIIIHEYTSGFTKVPAYMQYLYWGIGKAMGIYVVYCNGYYNSKATISMVGHEAEIRKAEYLYKVVYRLLEDKAQRYKAAFEKKNGCALRRKSMNDYRAGVARGFISAMMEAYAEAEQEIGKGQEMVLADTRWDDAQAFYLEDHEVTKNTNQSRNSIHAANGFDDGKELTVNEAVESNKPQTLKIGAIK